MALTSVRGPTLAAVLGYIWPRGDWKGRFLICVSMIALSLAKWLNTLVPFALKRAVDALEAQQSTLGASGTTVVMAVGGPLLGAYVATRLGVSLANEARSVAYAGVVQTAARRFSLREQLLPEPVPLGMEQQVQRVHVAAAHERKELFGDWSAVLVPRASQLDAIQHRLES